MNSARKPRMMLFPKGLLLLYGCFHRGKSLRPADTFEELRYERNVSMDGAGSNISSNASTPSPMTNDSKLDPVPSPSPEPRPPEDAEAPKDSEGPKAQEDSGKLPDPVPAHSPEPTPPEDAKAANDSEGPKAQEDSEKLPDPVPAPSPEPSPPEGAQAPKDSEGPKTQEELETLGDMIPMEGFDEVAPFVRFRAKNCRGKWMDDTKPEELKAATRITPPETPDSAMCKEEAFLKRDEASFARVKNSSLWELESNSTAACNGEGEGPSLHVWVTTAQDKVMLVKRRGADEEASVKVSVPTYMQKEEKKDGSCHGIEICELGDKILVQADGENDWEPMVRSEFFQKYVDCAGERKAELEKILGQAALLSLWLPWCVLLSSFLFIERL